MVREHGTEACVHPPSEGPVRTCVGCRLRAPKQELLRVVAGISESGPSVLADPGASEPGRGAYLHPTPDCLELATRRRAFARALRSTGRLDESALREHLQLKREN